MKVSVFIEETLCKEVIVDVEEGIAEDVAMQIAEEQVTEAYCNEEIVLTADDFNGVVQCKVQTESGTCTNWFNI